MYRAKWQGGVQTPVAARREHPVTTLPEGPLLGAYRLDAPLGRGGQGSVWAARHADTGLQVAVKIITAERARSAEALRNFRREVRAVARLDHPNVVMVLDQGEIPDTMGDLADRVVPGSPYLVMERAACSLGDLAMPLAWPETRATLRGILDGLAHAHARGVLHRDVKPGNILFPRRPRSVDDYAAACLADFGLAVDRSQGVGAGRMAMAGSPTFMAPEQFTGDGAEIGLETDLYAVGWVGWAIATDSHPLADFTLTGIRSLKLAGRLPTWPTKAVAPPAFRGWVERLLSSDPLLRFPSAAAARRALDALPDDVDSDLSPRGRAAASTTTEPTFDFLSADLDPIDDHSVWSPPEPGPTQVGMTTDTAPLDGDPHLDPEWMRDQWDVGFSADPLLPLPGRFPGAPRRRPFDLRGAGLALFGLRVPRLVGRDDVMEAIWSDLASVVEHGRPRHVLLHGPGGVGRTSVLTELQWAARTTSVAWTLSADSKDGRWALSAMIARAFGTAGLHPVDRERRISRRLRFHGIVDPVDVAAVVRLAALPGRGRMLSADDERGAFRVVLRALSRCGPVLMCMDDLEGLDPVACHAAAEVEGPVLVVWSSRDDVGAADPRTRSFLQDLAPIGRSLRALTSEEVRRTLEVEAGLETSFARRIASTAAGNPGLALQIVGDLLARGELRLSDRGYVASTSGDRVPVALHGGWDLHLDRLERQGGSAFLTAMAAAAALGQEVGRASWRAVLDCLDVEVPDHIAESWMDQGLLIGLPTGRGFRFAHPVLRLRALDRSPVPRATLHAACAQVLGERGAPSAAVGAQLLWAERPAEALDHLLVALEEAVSGVQAVGVDALVRQARSCLTLLDGAVGARKVLRLAVLEGRAAVQTTEFGLATERVKAAVDALPVDDPLGAQARLVRLMAAMGQVDLSTVLEQGPALLDHLRPRSEDHLKLRMLIGQAALYSGDHAAAMTWLEPGVDARSDSLLQGRVRVLLASALKARGDHVRALAHIDAAVAILEQHGARRWLGHAVNERGDVERRLEDLVAAERDYLRAVELFDVLGTAHALGPRINLGFLALARGEASVAETRLRLAMGQGLQTGQQGYAYAAAYGLIATTAAQADSLGYDRALRRIEELGARVHFADLDLAEAAEAGARDMATNGEFDRAAQGGRLAVRMWGELGRSDRADSLAERVVSWSAAP